MNLHMFFTKITRDASEVLKDQTKSISEDASKLDHMKQIKEIGIEIKTALEKGNPQKFGRLMNVHWDLKTKTSNKISDNCFGEPILNFEPVSLYIFFSSFSILCEN